MRFTRFKTTLAFAIPAVFTAWVWLDRLSSARSAAAAAESFLSLQVLDERGKPVMARLRLRDGAGQAKPPELLDGARAVPIHPRYPELGIVFPRDGRLRLPEGKSTIQLERGTEYEPVGDRAQCGVGPESQAHGDSTAPDPHGGKGMVVRGSSCPPGPRRYAGVDGSSRPQFRSHPDSLER